MVLLCANEWRTAAGDGTMAAAAAAMVEPSLPECSGTRSIYLIRHAESRYNRAIKQRSLVKMIGETDHGLSVQGLAQCRSLQDRILKATQCADAQALQATNRVTVSSPLCRAILTAHMALPPTHGAIVALPEAREHCMLPLLSRDSEGTLASRLQQHVASELVELVCGADCGLDKKEPPQPPCLDLSHLPPDQKWWTVAEGGHAVGLRIGTALRKIADIADAAPDAPTVLVGHSHAMRRIFSTYSTAEFADTPIGRRLGRELVENCAVIRVRLKDQDGTGVHGAPPRVVDAELLFGSNFRDEQSKSVDVV